VLRTLLALPLLAACSSEPKESTMTPPPPPSSSSASLSPGAEVHNAADRDAKAGDLVEVFGTYEQVAVGKAPDAPLDGHAAVRLDDGTLVHLQPPWDPKAIRPAEELARYAGKAVVVKGIVVPECPPPPDGGAYAKVPCLMMDIVIMERGTYDALERGVLE
jgi:hypothetical protein